MRYQLKIDREKARALREQGWTYQAIGAEFGASTVGAWKALNLRSEKNDWLRSLSPKERSDYRTFVQSGIRSHEARTMITERKAQ